jgi:hypothetical protein
MDYMAPAPAPESRGELRPSIVLEEGPSVIWHITARKIRVQAGAWGARTYLWCFVAQTSAGVPFAESLDFSGRAWGLWGRVHPPQTPEAEAALTALLHHLDAHGASRTPPAGRLPWYAWFGAAPTELVRASGGKETGP